MYLVNGTNSQHPKYSHVSCMTANLNQGLTVSEQHNSPLGVRNESIVSLLFYYQKCDCPVNDAITG